ncbi:enoyl-CoA hydratase [Bordetella bronchiseptica]|uniref:Enoyl-CoA hydratase/isomerase family protein n=2 Tax=Bordetella bronchiseptica TaxID=518 RepID=A0ABR4RI12_BORBO|nr:enoyl-CoA hydratase [Bordetella bronchiseptica]SHR17423.1 enoyl-CoA hydratase [Mycobacteroides abscessus subsp. abscessus]AWP73952.1 enoyl-CoA hydratase [Bordetella bronchiseptica]AZW20767.1 enoyl-CoA hydratase [Bordetella bronchiseptica]KCV35555.1 enoyl-CoA hydratase/isomerase family protein [Bordetella bronchiseptica 00-P-2796]KDB95970.1 enoyl-CoA hydratase/isomerase family protein [Bordetella bronchiseptica E010]
MSYEFIRVEHLGPVCRIYLNRPEVRNAQSRSLLRELDDAVRAAEADDAVRVLIIGAVGDHFSAGHDLKSARVERPNPTVEERWEYEEEHFLEYCLRIHDLKKPTIAQVQGACIAGGYMVANMCDLIVCADNAFFSDPVAHSMGTASLEVLIHPWVMGMRKAKELIFTGARLPAAEALQIGMINRVVPLAELEQATLELANTVAAAPPYGLRFTKRSLNRTWDAQGFRAAVQAHFDVHQLSHVTEEFQAHLKRGLDSTIKRAKAVS